MNRQVGGLIVSVLRNGSGDRSRGGLSAEYQELTVVNISGPFGPADDRPAVMLIQGPGRGPNPVLVPAIQNAAGAWEPAAGWWMSGGNYAATSNSRFSRAIQDLGGTFGMAAKILDRIEVADREVSVIDGDCNPVVIGTVRRRGMTWFALNHLGEQLSQHTSEDDAVRTIKSAAEVVA